MASFSQFWDWFFLNKRSFSGDVLGLWGPGGLIVISMTMGMRPAKLLQLKRATEKYESINEISRTIGKTCQVSAEACFKTLL